MKKVIAETERHRLLSFDCPNPDCRAKHIAFATNRETKNETELVPIDTSARRTRAAESVAKASASAMILWALSLWMN